MLLEIKIPASEVALTFPNGLSNEAFEELCFANQELVIEREADGKISIMSPVSTLSGQNESVFNGELYIYCRQFGGHSFSSSTGFTLPDGSVRSPDASYVTEAAMALHSRKDLLRFAPIVPLFVVEVASPSDQLAELALKMSQVWIKNGVALAWLVDVENEKLWIYRQNGTVDLIEGFDQSVTGEDVLPGFAFDLRLLR
ncbi:Uma2 family endonuclease [Neolewinella lacunae]|uniref:Uma2 family endonuclease n=1 Tax=Neolewinella lacunae TaxID=1517758 RepID=A0A923PJV5_9BACT|nr:Uma2 family endonuclease [Neolewinella lacunae]MBC6995417.1 Uma2 family endonuclease [Neolewinella lacunae]MDN3633840.1 Uma2 family endonuclease [Neolewinella lacunae]